MELVQRRRQGRDLGRIRDEKVFGKSPGGPRPDSGETFEVLEQDPHGGGAQIHQRPPSGRTLTISPPMIERASAIPGSFSASAMSPFPALPVWLNFEVYFVCARNDGR